MDVATCTTCGAFTPSADAACSACGALPRSLADTVSLKKVRTPHDVAQQPVATPPPPFPAAPAPPSGGSRPKVIVGAVVLLLVLAGGVLAFLQGRGDGTSSTPRPKPSPTTTVVDRTGSADGTQITRALQGFVDQVNAQDPVAAYDVLSPHAQAQTPLPAFLKQYAGATLGPFVVDSVDGGSSTTAEVSFRSTQGGTCTDWKVTYTMIRFNASWLIDEVSPHEGSPAAC